MSKPRPGEERSSSGERNAPHTSQKSRSRDSGPESELPLLIKHLAHAVIHGKKVTFHLSGPRSHTGYLAGHDEKSFLVLVPEAGSFVRKVVKRDHVTDVDLHDASTLRDEPCKEEMEKVFSTYRKWIFEKVYGQHQRKASPSPGGTP